MRPKIRSFGQCSGRNIGEKRVLCPQSPEFPRPHAPQVNTIHNGNLTKGPMSPMSYAPRVLSFYVPKVLSSPS